MYSSARGVSRLNSIPAYLHIKDPTLSPGFCRGQYLLIYCARDVGASVIIRGLRAVSDFEYEYQMVGMNRALDDSVETMFLMAEARYQAIASKLVKEIARLDGDVSKFVTPSVRDALYVRLKDPKD